MTNEPPNHAQEVQENTPYNLTKPDIVLEKLSQAAQKVFSALDSFKERTDKAIEAITVFVNSPKFERLQSAFPDFTQWFDPEHPDTNTKLDLFWLQQFFDNFDELMPFVEAELDRLHRERGVDNISLEEFLRDTDPDTANALNPYLRFALTMQTRQEPLKEIAAVLICRCLARIYHRCPNLKAKSRCAMLWQITPLQTALQDEQTPQPAHWFQLSIAAHLICPC